MTLEVAATSPPDRRPRSAQKSRIANGSALLSGNVGRSLWYRRFKELWADHLSDTPNASVAEKSILRRACTLECELERMETAFALAGEASPAELDIYARVSANLRRLLESVGLERRAKTVGPSLGDLIRQDQEAQRQRLAREREEAAS